MADGVPEKDFFVSIGMLSVFSAVGVAGNGLVLYGFWNYKPKLTSTIFILTLAFIDFTSCLLTIPATIAMELLEFQLSSDVSCKFYHFLLTTTIPFSAFIMVAIAFDRYFCICRSLQRVMTRHRAGVIVFSLSILALVIGVISCMRYGAETMYEQPNNMSLPPCNANMTDLRELQMYILDKTVSGNESAKCSSPGIMYCIVLPDPFFGKDFHVVFEKIYSSFYAICGIMVIVLYTIIYRFILVRRQQRLRSESFHCCSFNKSPLCDPENTEIIYMTQEPSQCTMNKADNKVSIEENHQSLLGKENKDNNSAFSAELSAINRRKEEKFRINNIKTAFMLSIVAFVFILAFLPAWMMKLMWIEFNIIVFYLYFVYNVANPFIYAFMNPEFQQKMGIIIRDLKKRWSSRTV